MSNPAKSLKKNWKKIVTVAAVAAVVYFTAGAAAPALAGAGTAGAAGAAGAAGGAAAVGGTGIGVGTGTLAASGAAGSITAAAPAMLSATAAPGFFSGLSPLTQAAMVQTGGQMLAGAMSPEPESQIDIMREQRRLNDSREIANAGGGFFTQPAGTQPSGATTTPVALAPQAMPLGQNYAEMPVQMAPTSDVFGRYNPQTGEWEQAE